MRCAAHTCARAKSNKLLVHVRHLSCCLNRRVKPAQASPESLPRLRLYLEIKNSPGVALVNGCALVGEAANRWAGLMLFLIYRMRSKSDRLEQLKIVVVNK